MAIDSRLSPDGNELTLMIKGRFDFSAHQEFRGSYEKLAKKPDRYIIDLKETAYVDSSALGMLLLLRDFAGGGNARIEIQHASDDVKRILTISNFDQLFTIQ